jgi:hypothetical protein
MELEWFRNAVVAQSRIFDTAIVLGSPVTPKSFFVRSVKRKRGDIVIADARRLT